MSGRQLLLSISSTEAWSWARTKDVEGEAKNLLDSLDKVASELVPAAHSFLIGVDVQDLIRLHGEDRLVSALSSLEEKLVVATSLMKDHVQRISGMHALMQSRGSK